MITLGYIKIMSATLFIAVVAGIKPEHQTAIICSGFGIFGGGIFQFLTYDDRKPTIRYLIGDLLASGVFGFGSYVTFQTDEVQVFFYSIIAGAAASGTFLVYIKNYKPWWLPKQIDTSPKEKG